MKVFFAFLIYSFIFLCVGGSLLTYYFDVSPFACFSVSTKEIFVNPFSDWYRLYMDFQHDNWAINSLENLIIFFIFLFFFPVWIGLWFILKRLNWEKIFMKPIYFYRRHFHKRNVEKPSVSKMIKTSSERPTAVPKSVKFGNVTLTAEAENTPKDEKKETPNTNASTDSSTKVQSGNSINLRQKEQLRVLGEKYGYELFEKVQLDDYLVPFVFATDTVALVTTFLMDDKEWIADESISEDGSEPTWFSSEGLIPSPFYKMVKASEFLREKEPTSEIIPVVVVGRGSILNVSSIKEQWDEKEGAVVLWNEGTAEGLDTLENLLKSKNEELAEVEEDSSLNTEE
ncbi:MAG: hypothetical protein J6Y03_04785 [Alphaproteobacteria bacterium]|nr:hypothetical protein [Alphaproteobacteria bacterium]